MQDSRNGHANLPRWPVAHSPTAPPCLFYGGEWVIARRPLQKGCNTSDGAMRGFRCVTPRTGELDPIGKPLWSGHRGGAPRCKPTMCASGLICSSCSLQFKQKNCFFVGQTCPFLFSFFKFKCQALLRIETENLCYHCLEDTVICNWASAFSHEDQLQ